MQVTPFRIERYLAEFQSSTPLSLAMSDAETITVGLLAERAVSAGVRIQTRTRVESVPPGPAIIATSLAAARRLAGDGSLVWPGARVATFDLGLRADTGPGWFRVVDLDDRIHAARYSLADPALAPPGHELIQIAAACAPAERKADAASRVPRLLDQAWPGWQAAVQWQRSSLRVDCTGAVDLPGTTWAERPAISRGQRLKVATDQSAAPGLFAEVGIAAAIRAVQQFDDDFGCPADPSRSMAPAAVLSRPGGGPAGDWL